jgi:acetyltransferase-like isoleucine patch superfamily enzyme
MPERKKFFKDIDTLTFNELTKKHFPPPGFLQKINKLSIWVKTQRILKKTGVNPFLLLKLIYINLLRQNTIQRTKLGFMLTRYCNVKLNKNAKIILNGTFDFGFNEFKNSKLESRLSIGQGASLIVNNKFTAYAGSDIRIIPNAVLTLNGGFCNNGVQITCGKKITIGKNCAIARDAIIRDYDAHKILDSNHKISKEIIIEDKVWIGNRAMILKGVTIGKGSVIAAGAIVTKNIPEKCLAAGVPAKVIRTDIEWE